jgi:hypothetical protein
MQSKTKFVHKPSIVWSLVKSKVENIMQCLSQDAWFSRCLSPSDVVTYLSQRYIAPCECTEGTQCTAGAAEIEWSHDQCCETFRTLSTCNSRAGAPAWVYATHNFSWQHPDAYVFRRLKQQLRERGIVTTMTDCTGINEWICSCGTKAVDKIKRYRTVIENIATQDPRNTSRKQTVSIPLLVERKLFHPVRTKFCECLCHRCTVDELLLHNTLWSDEVSFTHDGVYSTSTTVTSGHWIMFMLSENVDIKSASGSMSGVGIVEDIVMGP